MTGMEVRDIRVRLGMTQEDFAHFLGITPSVVAKWEMGKSKISKMAENLVQKKLKQHRMLMDKTKKTE